MKLILLLYFGLIVSVWGYNPTQNVNNNFEEQYSTDLTDRKIYDTDINTDVVTATEDTAYKKQWEENRAGKDKVEVPWFQNVSFSSCESPADYVCPPLTTQRQNEGYTTRVNFIDLVSGNISCSAHKTFATANDPLTSENQVAVHTEIFVNKACLEKYSKSANEDKSDAIEKLKGVNAEYLKELKAQEFKYTVDYKNSGDSKFLDLADVLDGLMSFNVDLFDFEQTLLHRELRTRNGYTTLPNEMIVDKVEKSFSNLVGLISGFDSNAKNEFLEHAGNQVIIKNASAKIANSSYFMLLDFWLKANDVIVLLAQGIAFIFIAYNAIFTWALPKIGTIIEKKKDYENNLQRAIVGFVALIGLFAGDVEKINIAYESKAQDLIQNEIIIQQTHVQAAIQVLYSETNYWADVFAELGIRAYLNQLNGSVGLLDESQITAMASEKKVLEKSIESFKKIDSDMCYANYDVSEIKDAVKKYRSMTLSKNDGENTLSGFIFDGTISSLDANPWPKSEAEAVAIMKYGSGYSSISPYNSSSDLYNKGFVKQSAMHKFRNPNFTPISLSGCYENTKKIIASQQRIREIDAQFAKLENPSVKDAKVEYIKVVNEIQWKMFAEQGYLSIIYLPITNLVMQNLGIIDELSELSSINQNDENKMVDFMENRMKELSTDIPMLMLFGGHNIAKMVHNIKEPLLNFAFDKLSNLGGPITKGINLSRQVYNALKKTNVSGDYDLLDLKIAAILIKSMGNIAIMALLLGTSIIMFTLLFIEKLFAFIASMFLLIYAFAKNQEERIGGAIARIFAIAFKTILLVICAILTMFALYLVSYLEHSLLNNFFNQLDGIENATWSYMFSSFEFGNILSLIKLFFEKYIIYGLVSVALLGTKVILVVSMMWKMPGFMYELIYEKVHSVSDSVGDTLQGSTEKIALKV